MLQSYYRSSDRHPQAPPPSPANRVACSHASHVLKDLRPTPGVFLLTLSRDARQCLSCCLSCTASSSGSGQGNLALGCDIVSTTLTSKSARMFLQMYPVSGPVVNCTSVLCSYGRLDCERRVACGIAHHQKLSCWVLNPSPYSDTNQCSCY